MTSPTTRYDRWKAPVGDGESLIWPAPAEIISDARDNQRRLNSANDIKIQNVPLPEVRRACGTGSATQTINP